MSDSFLGLKPLFFSICTEFSALCFPHFWSSYNGAQNFIRKQHAVDAKWILLSLSLINHVEMEGDLCILHSLLWTLDTDWWWCRNPHIRSSLFVGKNSNIICLKAWSSSVWQPMVTVFFARWGGPDWLWWSFCLAVYIAINILMFQKNYRKHQNHYTAML